MATSKAHLVRVEVFSNSSTMCLSRSSVPQRPARRFAFRSCPRSSKYRISSGVKSISVKKLLPFKFTAIVFFSFLFFLKINLIHFRAPRAKTNEIIFVRTCA